MTGYWLGVVQRAHVMRGVELGIAQVNHGKKNGLARLERDDGFVYYSPKTSYPDGDPLKEFTAIGRVDDDEPYQGEDGEFHPWRRRVRFSSAARAAPIALLMHHLDLTASSNWGYQLRRGLIELSERDFRSIADAMGVDA